MFVSDHMISPDPSQFLMVEDLFAVMAATPSCQMVSCSWGDYLDKDDWVYYQDISNFLYTIIMSCVTVILNNRDPENMHNTSCIIAACGAFVRESILNLLTVILLFLYMK